MPVKAAAEMRRYDRIAVSPMNIAAMAKDFGVTKKAVFDALVYKSNSPSAEAIRTAAMKDYFGIEVKGDLELKWREYPQ